MIYDTHMKKNGIPSMIKPSVKNTKSLLSFAPILQSRPTIISWASGSSDLVGILNRLNRTLQQYNLKVISLIANLSFDSSV